jgi:hypothetical protein
MYAITWQADSRGLPISERQHVEGVESDVLRFRDRVAEFMMIRTAAFVFAAITISAIAADPPVSGLKPGQRPGPYAAIVCTGQERGKAHCFICEAADRPTVIIMARKMTDPLGKLTQGLDQALVANKTAELRGWVTFFYDDQSTVDAQVTQWGRTHGIKNVPLGVFEDVDGPPAYRISKEAEVTVLLSVKQKVVKNFSFRTGELNEQRVKDVLADLPQILPKP